MPVTTNPEYQDDQSNLPLDESDKTPLLGRKKEPQRDAYAHFRKFPDIDSAPEKTERGLLNLVKMIYREAPEPAVMVSAMAAYALIMTAYLQF